jgi:hypothetical protein
MYRKLPESSGNVLAYALEASLTEEDVEKMQTEMSVAMDQHGPLHLLVKLDGLQDIEPSAVWQDLKMTPEYLQDVERVAVVGDERWHEWATKLSDAFADARFFAPDGLADALAWIEQPSSVEDHSPGR